MTSNSYNKSYQQCPIWQVFVGKATNSQKVFVEDLVNYAEPLLKRFSDTFPRYTDHGGRHQLNILNIISEILGDRVQDLTCLEAAIIILSAFYHDIGMVYTDDEKNNIDKENDFQEFLKHDTNAELSYIENNNITSLDLKEWYYRWAHAKRVYVYLNKIETNHSGVENLSLSWNKKISIRIKLGLVCESHNWNAEQLKSDNFDISYLNEADLRFCAILLRLGDVLDFDYSRAEESIYNYLKLNNANNDKDTYSKKEWEKHISSQGFSFPTEIRNQPYEINFIAAPSKPETEVDISEFLDYIDFELEQCKRILQYCSNKWRSIFLPDRISRNIISQGYQSGDFKFTLDQKQVLNLLMGEQIYQNKYVFVRELLQNALDTTRHKAFYEKSNGQINYEPKPIEITSWIDDDGYKWIRFDDFGIGMNENIIKKYLLKVGTSYYNSAEFKVDKLEYKKKSSKDFTPISRFGIGLLSCFMVGDRVEISTWKRGSNPVRLSIIGLHNHYILQTGSDIASEMPSETKSNYGYRHEEGTSIAVRIDPYKERSDFKLEQLLDKWLFSSMVPVKYKGTMVGGKSDLVNYPMLQSFEEYIDDESILNISKFLNIEIDGKVGIIGYPIDLTSKSISSYLKGQLIVFKLVLPEALSNRYTRIHISLSAKYGNNPYNNYSGQNFSIVVIKESLINGRTTQETLSIPLPKLDVLFFEISNTYKFLLSKDFRYNKGLLIHNNIVIDFISLNEYLFKSSGYEPKHFTIGFISLYDELRPDINVARDKVEQLNWKIWSQIDLALMQHENVFNEFYDGIISREYWSMNLSENSVDSILYKFIIDNIQIISKYIYYYVNDAKVSFEDLILIVNENKFPIKIQNVNNSITLRVISEALIKTSYNIKFFIVEGIENTNSVSESYYIITDSEKPSLIEADHKLPPLFFVKFQGSNKLYFPRSINSDHRLGNWIRNNFTYLASNYLGFLNDLIFEITSTGSYRTQIEISIEAYYNNKVESINKTLTRLMRLSNIEFKDKPTYDIFLNTNDFYLI